MPTQKTKAVAEYAVVWYPDSTHLHEGARNNSIFKLLIVEDFSLFLSERSHFTDSASANDLFTNNNLEKLTVQIVNKSKGFYKPQWVYKYQDHIKSYHLMGGRLHVYEENFPLMDWRILQDRREVAGYSCQKATTHFAGRDYVAWFTTEIPYQDGPYKFSGLPGFIVKLQDAQRHYTFTLKSFNEKQVLVFKHKEDELTEMYKQTAKNTYFKREAGFYQSYVEQSEAAGMGFTASEEELRRKNEAARKRYNPIERIVE